MIDENAFGVLISYFAIEDDEYAHDADHFRERFTLFGRLLLDFLAERELTPNTSATLLGHALYLELPEEDILDPELTDAAALSEKKRSLLAWVRGARARLSETDFESVAIVTHGGRWVRGGSDDVAEPASSRAGNTRVLRVSFPSEPFRRALYAETASHGVPSEEQAWGPGLYADTEALSAIGLTPKNAPTPLEAADATFYRVSR
jgi:hypothetical protein